LGNYSTGKMGFALAEALAEDGAIVNLVTGPSSCSTDHPSIRVFRVQTAEEMYETCKTLFPKCTGAILAAAVADYRPKNSHKEKIKKKHLYAFDLDLEQTPDILYYLGRQKKAGQIVAGFSLESETPEANAIAKLRTKHLDLVVLNKINNQGSTFGDQSVAFKVIDKHENISPYQALPKVEMAKVIIDHFKNQLNPSPSK
jgi:phosphopantothenoylcysteine decarboxylase/phosphopantothenate--cysteine ligase